MYHTFVYTAPNKYLFSDAPAELNNVAHKILEVLIDLDLTENPILFHVFSNGGAFVYKYLSKIITARPRWNVVGCVFDSLPARRDASVATRAMMSSVNTNFVFRYLLGFLFYSYLVTARFFVRMFYTTSSDSAEMFWDFMSNEPANWPCLYLYSKTDALVDFRYVEEVMERRRRLGVDISSKCWPDSDHVAHLRKYPTEYRQLSLQFLERCLSQTTNTSTSKS